MDTPYICCHNSIIMRFGILGSGSWATALCKILTDNQHHVNWWIRNTASIQHIRQRGHNPHYLNSAFFDTGLLTMNDDIATIISQSDTLVIAIPSAYAAASLHELNRGIFKGKKIISAIKGILPEQNILLNQYLESQFAVPLSDYFAVLGPCHAEEVAAEKLSYLTFSGMDEAMTAEIAGHFKTSYMNTVVNHDILGVQYAAVLKNIYAVGAGMAHGLDYGDNFLSVYIANSANEMVSFLRKLVWDKNQEDSVKAVSINYAASVYLGDLLVTCYSLYSRNRTFGNMIGKGYGVKAAQLEMNMVAEGFNASRCMYLINREIGASMPIAATIYQVLWENLPAAEGFKKIEQCLV
jgi:glycerol-3-phosphate dehydrogenase (NAD(P)+)